MKKQFAVLGNLAAMLLLVATIGFAQSRATEITLAIWEGHSGIPVGKPDAFTAQIQKDLNITITTVPYGWADYGEKYNLWAASNDLPDITCADPGKSTAASWAEGGVIRPLPSDLGKYPYLKKYLDQPATKMVTFGGKIFAVPRHVFADSSYAYEQTILVAHKDIYDSLGLKKFPETMDELKSMLRAIKVKYPTITPLVFWNSMGPANLVHNYMPAMGGWVMEGGKYIPGFFSKMTLDAVKAFRSLMSEGLVDKEFVAQGNTDTGRMKWINKEGAVMTASPMPNHWPQNSDQYKQKWGTNIYDNIVWGQNPAGLNGKNYFEPSLPGSESYFSAKVDDQKMDRILALYDYLLSPKGENLRHYGLEGVDFNTSAGKVVITRAKEADGKTFKALGSIYPSFYQWNWLVTWGEDFPFMDPTVDPRLHQLGVDYFTWKKTKAGPVPGYNVMLGALSTPLKDKFALDWGADLFALFSSTDDLNKQWDAVVTKYKKAGLDEMVAEVNRIGKEKGYIK